MSNALLIRHVQMWQTIAHVVQPELILIYCSQISHFRIILEWQWCSSKGLSWSEKSEVERGNFRFRPGARLMHSRAFTLRQNSENIFMLPTCEKDGKLEFQIRFQQCLRSNIPEFILKEAIIRSSLARLVFKVSAYAI